MPASGIIRFRLEGITSARRHLDDALRFGIPAVVALHGRELEGALPDIYRSFAPRGKGPARHGRFADSIFGMHETDGAKFRVAVMIPPDKVALRGWLAEGTAAHNIPRAFGRALPFGTHGRFGGRFHPGTWGTHPNPHWEERALVPAAAVIDEAGIALARRITEVLAA